MFVKTVTSSQDPSCEPSDVPNPIVTAITNVPVCPSTSAAGSVAVTPDAKRSDRDTSPTRTTKGTPVPESTIDAVGGAVEEIEGVGGQEVVTSDPDDLDLASAIEYSKKCKNTVGAELAKDATVCTASYAKDRKRVVNQFIEALRKEAPKYNRFLKKTSCVPCFFALDKPVEAVFVMLSDANDKSKRIEKVRILNDMLIDWVAGMELKRSRKNVSKKWHSPASINVTLRKFLSAAKEYCGWEYSISEFSFEGGFNAFFSKLCEKRQREDVSL